MSSKLDFWAPSLICSFHRLSYIFEGVFAWLPCIGVTPVVWPFGKQHVATVDI